MDIVNQTDLVSEVDSSSIEGIAVMDFGINIVNIVNIVNIIDLGIVVIEMEVIKTRSRLKEE